ncbi:unnamed protein product [Eruca vesicaria subsp. sativa]|uniref:Uncharacterized protein n=1 Tax=Eruca vesicaria subsp. sativa TaxID=29727 RepID=A0ABC8L9R2_ERUVS|nr:unnamed protein product [Eruca vesicaria subsp. sativa]
MKSEQTRSPVIAAIYGGVAGAIYGGLAGMFIPPLVRPCFKVLGAQLSQAQCARMGAREFSAFTAALFGFESITRSKDGLMSRLVSAGGVGLVYSFVKQGFNVRPAHALSYTAAFTVLSGTMFR